MTGRQLCCSERQGTRPDCRSCLRPRPSALKRYWGIDGFALLHRARNLTLAKGRYVVDAESINIGIFGTTAHLLSAPAVSAIICLCAIGAMELVLLRGATAKSVNIGAADRSTSLQIVPVIWLALSS
jgi:hypothetical protein